MKKDLKEISSVTGRFAGSWQQDVPEPQFILPNKTRILNGESGKPEIWFDRGGYTQMHFPVASKIFAGDDESQKMYAKYSIKNTGVKYELDLNPIDLDYQYFYNDVKLDGDIRESRRVGLSILRDLQKESTKGRDYKKEYEEYHSKPEQKKRRAGRNAARRKMEKLGHVKKGDSKEVHHRNRDTLDNSSKNIVAIPKSKNRSMNGK